MNSKWYVVIASSNKESETTQALENYGLICYNPIVKIPSNKDGEIFKPLFPGYLFAQTKDEKAKLPSISQVNGIYGWLKFGDEIPYIDNNIIIEIKQNLTKLNSSYGLWSNFKTGEKVIIQAGKLSEFAEMIENAKSPYENAKVLMYFMGRKIPALVPWHNIKPIKSSDNKINTRRTRGQGRRIRNSNSKLTQSLVLQK